MRIRLFEGAMGSIGYAFLLRTPGIQASLMSPGLASVVTEKKLVSSRKDFIKAQLEHFKRDSYIFAARLKK